MRCLGVTHQGIEDVAATEVSELLKTEASIIDSAIIFEVSETKDICKLSYTAQSLRRVVLLLGEISYTDIDSMEAAGKEVDPGEWILGKTFCLRCSKTENVQFSSQEIERAVGGAIKDKSGSEVDLEDPDVMFFAHVTEDKVYVGVDFSGFDMGKREYNIFSVQRSLKGDISYALFRLADMKNEGVFMDPFSGSGGIPIEAGMWLTGKSPHHYSKDKFCFLKYDLGFDTEEFLDSLDEPKTHAGKVWALDLTQNFLNSSKKNAKIAGVNKAISFSRVDTDWLDLKFTEVDAVATFVARDHVLQLNSLFQQFGRFLKGRAVIVCDAPELEAAAEKHGFKIVESRVIHQGKTALPVHIFQKAL